MPNRNDVDIADLIAAVARQYRKRVREPELRPNDVRLEIVRKLDLIRQSIKGLMKFKQKELFK